MEDSWISADAYNAFMGRWSRLIAIEFIHWLAPSPRLSWFELGCGTGALTMALLELTDPTTILACDTSESLLDVARRQIPDERVNFVVGSSDNIPQSSEAYDVIVSGLVLNFVPNPNGLIESVKRFLNSEGIIGGYVWDYATRMEFLRVFWDAASTIDPTTVDLDEGKRFPLCKPAPLEALFRSAGLKDVLVEPIEIKTKFESFSDYWEPFLGGTGPAPTYVKSLGVESREELMNNLRTRLLPDGDHGFELVARAWAVKGSI